MAGGSPALGQVVTYDTFDWATWCIWSNDAAWVNGTRKHLYQLSAIETTELMASGRVSRHDLRQDIFGHAK